MITLAKEKNNNIEVLGFIILKDNIRNSAKETLKYFKEQDVEIKIISGLDFEPIFNPYVCDYFQGMTVTVGLHARLLGKKVTAHDVWEMFAAHYANTNFVKVAGFMGEGTLPEQFIPANTLAGTNNMEIFVYGNDDRIMITTRFDNLGKGASGAAVQCMNIAMGIDETTSL